MGFLDETTSTWRADPINRVTTNNGGIQLKTDLEWSNGGIYFASGYDNIEGCGPSIAPTSMLTTGPTKAPTAECADISGCYTFNFINSQFGYLDPLDHSMCTYRIQYATKAEGFSGLRPGNPTHLRFFVDSNGDSQVEMGFLDETTSTWRADPISRVTTSNGGIQLKMDLIWSNGGIYFASGYDNIEGCGVSSAPTLAPTADDVFVSNEDSCPAQSEHLTHVDCRAAAEKLGIQYWGSNPAAPRGCWKFVNPINGATYVFGNVNDGNNIQHADISPICRRTNECADVSGCYTFNFIDSRFGYLDPLDQSMCTYRIQHAWKAEGSSGLLPANPTHLRFVVDSNGDSQVEMGFLDETTSTWTADPISRVTTNNGGIQLKVDLIWSNGGIYFASGYDDIEGCGLSSAPTMMLTSRRPTLMPTVESTTTPTSGNIFKI
jgi:hypothetical protein